MDANIHTIIVGASTVAGAVSVEKGFGLPVVSPIFAGALGKFANFGLGAVLFYLGHKMDSDGISDVIQGFGLGMALDSAFTFIGF